MSSCTYVVNGRGVKTHNWTWQSSADGALTGLGSSDPIAGVLKQVQFVPSVLSGFAPSSGYDVELQDGNGFDWLMGRGANCPADLDDALQVKGFVTSSHNEPMLCGEELTPEISNAGAAKTGILRIITIDPKWM